MVRSVSDTGTTAIRRSGDGVRAASCSPATGSRSPVVNDVHDPEERFQSDWYRRYRRMFADMLSSPPDPGVRARTGVAARGHALLVGKRQATT